MKKKKKLKKNINFNMRGTGNDFLMIKIRDVHWTPAKRKKSVQRKRNLIRKFILNSLSFTGFIFYALCKASLSQYA